MTVTQADITKILQLANLGAQLISTLGIPIAKVIEIFREAGVPEEQLAELKVLWGNLVTTIEQRIKTLQGTV